MRSVSRPSFGALAPASSLAITHSSFPLLQHTNYNFRGKTISPEALAEMNDADNVKRLIRKGQNELSEELQKQLLKHLTGIKTLENFLECDIF